VFDLEYLRQVNEVDVAPPAFYSPRLYKLFEVDESVLVLASVSARRETQKCSQKLPIFRLGGV